MTNWDDPDDPYYSELEQQIIEDMTNDPELKRAHDAWAAGEIPTDTISKDDVLAFIDGLEQP